MRNCTECVKNQKHFGVREYETEAGRGKKQRKELVSGGLYKLLKSLDF